MTGSDFFETLFRQRGRNREKSMSVARPPGDAAAASGGGLCGRQGQGCNEKTLKAETSQTEISGTACGKSSQRALKTGNLCVFRAPVSTSSSSSSLATTGTADVKGSSSDVVGNSNLSFGKSRVESSMPMNESSSVSMVNFLKSLVRISGCPTDSEFAQVSNNANLITSIGSSSSVESESKTHRFRLSFPL